MADRIVTEHPQPVPSLDPDSPSAKPAVSRGARACTVCRAAKMKCVGAEDDGAKPCQRCRRSNLECIFEKHRRGRKPGSKLSEASKMLRKLEKGVNSQKVKGQEPPDISPAQIPFPVSDSRSAPLDAAYHSRYSPRELYVPSQAPRATNNASPYPPSSTNSLNHSHGHSQFPTLTAPYPARYSQSAPLLPHPAPSSSSQHSMDEEDEEDDKDGDDTMYPAKMVEREGRRQSFFSTVLTNTDEDTVGDKPPAQKTQSPSQPAMQPRAHDIAIPRLPSTTLDDPVTAGIIAESELSVLFEMVYVRLNPFINLFDPALHSPTYVRTRCPFLFTTLLMAGCKYWKPERFRACQRLAEDFCLRAFQESWKRVEVVQAFMCMTYWKEPDDTRTWTYIGYACRMAVELGLNTYCAVPSGGETQLQRLERRNRERTYLVLWVHDRSLSMQTGRQWMLPEDDLVRNSEKWHQDSTLLPIDVVVTAQVQLRRIAAEVTDVFYLHKGRIGALHADVNYEILLRGCNTKLHTWGDHWLETIRHAGGERFHFSLLSFFKLHVRLFLNSFGLHSSLVASPSLPALSVCYTSAVDTLKLVTNDFATVDMLRYGQDSITVMTAYSAVFLLKLLRSTIAGQELGEGAHEQVYNLIAAAADAYSDAAKLMLSSGSVEYHGRFLRTLVQKDRALRQRQAERERKAEQQRAHANANANAAAHEISPTATHAHAGPLARLTPPNSAAMPYPRAPNSLTNGNGGGGVNGNGGANTNGNTNTNGTGHGRPAPAVVTAGLYQPRPTHPSAGGSGSGNGYANHAWHFPASPHLPAHPLVSPEGEMALELHAAGMHPGAGFVHAAPDAEGQAQHQKMEVAYWYNMHSEMGYGSGINPTPATYVNVPQQYRPLDQQLPPPYGPHPNGSLSAG